MTACLSTDGPMPDSAVRHPHLQDCAERAAHVLQAVEPLRDRYSEAQLAWQPTPDAWNMLECLDHLTVLDELYFEQIRDRLAYDALPRSDAPFEPSLFGRMFHAAVKPGGRFRMKTIGLFKPSREALSDPATVDRFVAHQHELLDLMGEADGLDLNRVKIASPASRFVRLRLGEAFWIMTTHQERHLQQLQRIPEQPGFPHP